MDIGKMIQDHLETNPLQQGIVGIQLPGMVSVDVINSVVTELFYQSDLQVVIIPPPLTNVFNPIHDKDVKAIAGRVQRDRLDGIRYNRVYIALYWNELGSLNAHHHDIFFNFEEHGTTGSYQVSVSDNREFGGDKIVIANQLKSTLAGLNSTNASDEPINMLFSTKSIALRKPEDWWIDLPEFTDKKHMAASLLNYIQSNQELFVNVIKEIKDRVTKDMFGVGTILEFPECLNVKAIMTNGPRGKFVRIQVGMSYFSFSGERAMAFDWYKLMVDQLDLMVSV